MIALVVPFIDNWEFTEKCIQRAVQNSRHAFELIVIDNGSDKNYEKQIRAMLTSNVHFLYIRNKSNLGVITAFNEGLKYAVSDIICFIHNDVLLQEMNWETKIEAAFENDPKLGLAGLLGGNGVHPDGGRINVVSNMRGDEWGKCGCHPTAALHHGSQLEGTFPAMVLDGVGLFFRRECMQEIQDKTSALDANVRAPHHWYDRNLTLHAAELGWHVVVIGVGFDHWSGATANTSGKYHELAARWLQMHPDLKNEHEGKTMDEAMYWIGEHQFRSEWQDKLPATVDASHDITWKKVF